MVQWLGLHALVAEGPGSIPGRATKIPQAMQCDKKKKNEKNLGTELQTLLLGVERTHGIGKVGGEVVGR